MRPFDRQLLIKIILIRRQRLRAKQKQRAMCIRPILHNRLSHGESYLVQELRSDPHYHHKYFRMNKESFDEILSLIEVDITHKRTHSNPIPPIDKLALTLRYIASGNSQVSLAMSYRFSQSAVSGIVREVIYAICKKLGPIFLPKPTQEMWIQNEKVFCTKWNHPNACGAVDGKHIRIQAPALSGSTHFNYKNFFSIVLLAIADPNYKFTAVHIGSSGSQSDGGILGRSSLGVALENGTINLPPPKPVGGTMLPHVILGDDAFPLRKYMMKPFPGKFLEREKRIYNYRMSRGRIVVENAFGILSVRWRIFLSTIIADLELTKKIVECGVILHNFCILKQDLNGITGDTFDGEEVVDGNWRDDNLQMDGISQQGSNRSADEAICVRQAFSDYFNGEGAVSWQDSRI